MRREGGDIEMVGSRLKQATGMILTGCSGDFIFSQLAIYQTGSSLMTVYAAQFSGVILDILASDKLSYYCIAKLRRIFMGF
jgi:hypothetical protein